MSLLWLFITIAQAAKPAVCSADISRHSFEHRQNRLWLPEGFYERAIRPSMLRLQHDACRCLPRRRSRRPKVAVGHVHVEPNAGRVVISYSLRGEDTPRLERMLRCMGAPSFTVEAMPYTSDIIYPDGRKEVLPPFPLWLHLFDEGED